jgi:hypothetical protein
MVAAGAPPGAAPYLRGAGGGVGPPGGALEVDNLLLLSMLAATVAIPAFTARIPDGRRALAWTVLLLVAFTLAYVAVVTGFYASHYVPEPFE